MIELNLAQSIFVVIFSRQFCYFVSHSRELFGILLSSTLVAKQLSCQVAFLRDVNDDIITHFSDVSRVTVVSDVYCC